MVLSVMLINQMTQKSDFRLSPSFNPPNESERIALGILLRNGPTSQAELTRMMKQTQPTVSRIVSSLVSKGMVEMGSSPHSGRGQPSVLLSLKADYAYALGISLVGDAICAEFIDFAGNVLWNIRQPLEFMGRDLIIENIRNFKKHIIENLGIDSKRLFAIGVGFSGFFVGEGLLMNPPATLDEWALVDIGQIIYDEINIPVLVDNDGNVAAIGESLRGVGRRLRNFAYFQITNGFGGGIVIDGKPYRGTYGNAGEFAVVWAAMGIEHPNLARLQKLLKENGDDYSSYSQMLAMVKPDDKGAQLWLDEASFAYSVAAAAAAAVIDCEAVVLGGQIPPLLAIELAQRINLNVTQRRDRPKPLPIILPSELQEENHDNVSFGAAIFALQSTFFG